MNSIPSPYSLFSKAGDLRPVWGVDQEEDKSRELWIGWCPKIVLQEKNQIHNKILWQSNMRCSTINTSPCPLLSSYKIFPKFVGKSEMSSSESATLDWAVYVTSTLAESFSGVKYLRYLFTKWWILFLFSKFPLTTFLNTLLFLSKRVSSGELWRDGAFRYVLRYRAFVFSEKVSRIQPLCYDLNKKVFFYSCVNGFIEKCSLNYFTNC